MSVKLTAAVWERGGITPAEKLVLLALADRADDAGLCWPSMADIADRCGISERHARRHVRELEQKGVITCDGKGGRGRSNRYLILPETRTDTSGYSAEKPGQARPGKDGETRTEKRTPASGFKPLQTAKPGQNRPETRTRVSGEPSGTLREEEISTGSVSSSQAAREAQDFREQVLAAAGIDLGRDRNPARWFGTDSLIAIQRWRDLGLTGDEILAEVGRVAARARHPPSRLTYFDPAMQELAGLKRAPPLEPIPPSSQPSNGARHDRPARAQITPGEQSVIRRRQLRGAIAAAVEDDQPAPRSAGDGPRRLGRG